MLVPSAIIDPDPSRVHHSDVFKLLSDLAWSVPICMVCVGPRIRIMGPMQDTMGTKMITTYSYYSGKSLSITQDICYTGLSGRNSLVYFVRKSVMSIKFPPAILGPEMAAPILWAPGIFLVLSAGKPPCP